MLPMKQPKDELAAIKLLERVEVLQVYKTKISNVFPRALLALAAKIIIAPHARSSFRAAFTRFIRKCR